MTATRHDTLRRVWRGGRWHEGARTLPEEVPVALSFNGTTQAVMMATPADLEDFGTGFALSEGLASRPEEIRDLCVVDHGAGMDVQIWLVEEAEERLAQRRRRMAGPVGCGLCGIDSVAEALRPVRPVPPSHLTLSPRQVVRAVSALRDGQRLHEATRAAHGAGFFTPHGLFAIREDIGRHNALDKLAGALARAGTDRTNGAILLTSRVSIDMIQKAAAIGAPVVIAVSAPTAHAVRLADAAGITLVALARGDGFEVFTHAHRITEDAAAHVQ